MTWPWYAACLFVVAVCVWIAWDMRHPRQDDDDPSEDGGF